MSSLEVLTYAPKRQSHRRFKKTKKRIDVSSDTLDIMATQHNLTEWQKELIRKVEIERQNFSHVARCCGVSRQYVSQEYTRLYNKITA